MNNDKIITDRFNHYILGIPLIDEQHKQLASNFKTLLRLIEQEEYDQALKQAEILLSNTVEHFKTEEIFMADINFPFSRISCWRTCTTSI